MFGILCMVAHAHTGRRICKDVPALALYKPGDYSASWPSAPLALCFNRDNGCNLGIYWCKIIVLQTIQKLCSERIL